MNTKLKVGIASIRERGWKENKYIIKEQIDDEEIIAKGLRI